MVGTPIGNMADISKRAGEILSRVEVVVCEDTRVTSRLLSELEKISNFKFQKPSLFRLDENVQMRMIPKVINWLETGTDVALVTDAGMPCISDPGWRAVDAVWEAGFRVEVIPGPSALDTAIVASGMDAARVWFGGFLPKKEKHQLEVLEQIGQQLKTGFITMAVLYESPKRLKDTVRGISQVVGLSGSRVVACGELTKIHEKVIRGTAEEVLEKLPHEIKGEWVVGISG